MRIKILFIGLLVHTLCFASCGTESVINRAPLDNPMKTDEATVYVTTANRSRELTKLQLSVFSQCTSKNNIIRINPATRYQTMDGFGAAITGSTCYNLLKMTADNRAKFLKETFSPTEGYGYSYVRISIGCSDFSLSEYSCCDTPGIEHFALTSEETDYVIPILKEILTINPDVKIIAAPWSAPRWMKVDEKDRTKPYNAWIGGCLGYDYYQDYATYFVKWIQAFKQNGLDIYAVTPQNEPLNGGNSASTVMFATDQNKFVAEALGPQFKQAGIATKIYAYDHNYNYEGNSTQKDYPVQLYNNPLAASFLTGAAYHNYMGSFSELADIHQQADDKELIFTETSIGQWNDGRNLSTRLLDDMKEVVFGTVSNWCKAVIVWNLMLDNEMGPNREHGCQSCYGAVDISRADYATIRKNSHYFIIGQIAAVVHPYAVRIGLETVPMAGVNAMAFENPNGTYAVVLMNENGKEQEVTVCDGTNYLTYRVPARAVASFIWNK